MSISLSIVSLANCAPLEASKHLAKESCTYVMSTACPRLSTTTKRIQGGGVMGLRSYSIEYVRISSAEKKPELVSSGVTHFVSKTAHASSDGLLHDLEAVSGQSGHAMMQVC